MCTDYIGGQKRLTHTLIILSFASLITGITMYSILQEDGRANRRLPSWRV